MSSHGLHTFFVLSRASDLLCCKLFAGRTLHLLDPHLFHCHASLFTILHHLWVVAFVRSRIHHVQAFRWSHEVVDGLAKTPAVPVSHNHVASPSGCGSCLAKSSSGSHREVTSHSCGRIRNSFRAASPQANRSRLFGYLC